MFAASCTNPQEEGRERPPASSPGSPAASAAPLPNLESVDTATTSKTAPDALPNAPDADDVVTSAQAPNSRLAGETFALKLSQLVIDVRDDIDIKKVVAEIASDELPNEEQDALVYEVTSQHASGLGRRWKTEEPMWIRSVTEGPANTPRRVNVEIAGVLAVGDPDYVGWNKIRIDVVRESDSWRLIKLSASPFRPDDLSVNRATVKLGDYLEGPGWREIAPS